MEISIKKYYVKTISFTKIIVINAKHPFCNTQDHALKSTKHISRYLCFAGTATHYQGDPRKAMTRQAFKIGFSL